MRRLLSPLYYLFTKLGKTFLKPIGYSAKVLYQNLLWKSRTTFLTRRMKYLRKEEKQKLSEFCLLSLLDQVKIYLENPSSLRIKVRNL